VTPREPSRAITLVWAVAGLAAAAFYFGWLLQPERVGIAWLFGALVVADLFNAFHALSFWATCLRRPRERVRRAPARPPRVDVFIPTLNEPAEVLEPTIRAAAAMRGAHLRVIVLDDGGRLEIAALARRLGVQYLARTERGGAKAGNINHALRVTDRGGAPYVCVFDSDHVPRPQFLERTLPLFADERMALVQTPQVYANADRGPLTRGAAEQQAIFFGPICAGRDGFGAAFCCGTNFVARRATLDAAGGFPEDSITEDIVLSTRLIGLGCEIAYVGEPLADGLGPEDAKSYASQQLRWATGCLDLLLRRPSLWRSLSWAQRWQFFVATSYWLTGWTILVYLSLPVMRLLFGWQPIGADAEGFTLHFLPYFAVAIVNLARFTSGGYSIRGLLLNWGSFPLHIRATFRALLGRSRGFSVTSKSALSGVAWGALAPNVACVAVIASAVVVGLAGGVTPAIVNNVSFALLDAVLVGSLAALALRQSRVLRAGEARTDVAAEPPREAIASAAGGAG
jgi:cellulose synthase (UDP-forming)